MLMCAWGCGVRCDRLLRQRLVFFWKSPSASAGHRMASGPLCCVFEFVCVDTLRWLVRKGLIFLLGNNSLCGQKKEFKVHGIFVTSFCYFLLRCFSNFKMMEYSLHYLCFFQPIETTSQLFPLLASYKLRLYHFPERPCFGVVFVLMW